MWGSCEVVACSEASNPNTQSCISFKISFPHRWILRWDGLYTSTLARHNQPLVRRDKGSGRNVPMDKLCHSVPLLGFLAMWPAPVDYSGKDAQWLEQRVWSSHCEQCLPWAELLLSAMRHQGSWTSLVIWQLVTDLADWDLGEKSWPGFLHSWSHMFLKWERKRRKKPRIALYIGKMEGCYKASKARESQTAPTFLQP